MVSFISLPIEVLFQSITGSELPITRSAIRVFAHRYCSLRLVHKPLTKNIDYCWKVCLEFLWNDWKNALEWKDVSKEGFVKQLFCRSNLIVNWIDGNPKVTKQAYSNIQNKELVLEIDAPVKGCVYKWVGDCNPILFSESFSANICYSSYYFMCNKTVAIQGIDEFYGTVIFYHAEGMKEIGRISGVSERRILSKSILNEEAAYIFTAHFNDAINSFDQFEMDVYDVSACLKFNCKLPFYLMSAYTFGDNLIFYCYHEGALRLAKASLNRDNPQFIYSSFIEQSNRLSKLVEVQGQLLFLSLDKAMLSIQVVEIAKDQINLSPMNLSGSKDFALHSSILSVCSHLDKLFVASYDDNYKPSLYVIDLNSQCMKMIKTLDIRWLNHDISMISISLGVVQVFIPDRYEPYALTLDYLFQRSNVDDKSILHITL